MQSPLLKLQQCF